MSQLEVTKLTEHVAIGPTAGNIAVSKLVMYVVAYPSSDGGDDTSNKQGHVHTRIVSR